MPGFFDPYKENVRKLISDAQSVTLFSWSRQRSASSLRHYNPSGALISAGCGLIALHDLAPRDIEEVNLNYFTSLALAKLVEVSLEAVFEGALGLPTELATIFTYATLYLASKAYNEHFPEDERGARPAPRPR